MAKPPGLFRREGVWYYRRLVPDDLRPIIGKAEIRGSLRTYDYAEAKRLARLAAVDADVQLAAARPMLNSQFVAGREQNSLPVTLNEAGIKAMVVEDFYVQERKGTAEAARLGADQEILDDLDFAEQELVAMDDSGLEIIASVTTTIMANNGVHVAWPSTGPIKVNWPGPEPSITIDPSGPEYKLATGLVRQALLEHTRRSRRRFAHADFSDTTDDPMFAGVTAQVAPVEPAANEITFQGLVDEYMNEPKRVNFKPKTRTNYEGMFRVLVQIIGGDKLARSVTREEAKAVRDLLIRLPKNATKHLPGVAPEEAAEIAEQRGMPTLSPATFNDYVGAFSALFRFATREGWIPSNVAEELAVKEDRQPRDARDAFTDHQLARIFDADLFSEPKEEWTHTQWVPVIALHSGMRLGEIVQLRCEDIEEVDGVDVVLIRAGPGQSLKNANARRLLPIHPAIKDDLLAHVERQRARGEDRVFPDKPPRSVGESFRRYLKKVGAKVSGGGMHQFRHLIADKLAEAHVPGDIIDALMGWARPGMRNLYGSGIRASVVAVEIAKVSFDIDLE